VYQRYCHVYKKGELEDLCRSVPGCRLVSAGFDKSNWFVELLRVREERAVGFAPEAPMPTIKIRNL
jgi:hypothetical protein